MKNNNKIKKYPIFYQGQKYEIRLKKYQYDDTCGGLYKERVIEIYKIKEYNIFFKKIFKRKKVFDIDIDKILKKWTVKDKKCNVIYKIIDRELNKNSDEYYVQLFKNAFQLYIDELNKEAQEQEKENRKLTVLEDWNGVIND